MSSLRKQLTGTGVALVTPFKADTSIDFDALEKLINYVIGNGVEYVVTLGTTGETPTLDRQEKIDLIHLGRLCKKLGLKFRNKSGLVSFSDR